MLEGYIWMSPCVGGLLLIHDLRTLPVALGTSLVRDSGTHSCRHSSMHAYVDVVRSWVRLSTIFGYSLFDGFVPCCSQQTCYTCELWWATESTVSVCGMWVCGMRMQAFCSIATEFFGYAAIWLWAAFEPHNFQTRICAHFDAQDFQKCRMRKL
jgi:hypothetical protein